MSRFRFLTLCLVVLLAALPAFSQSGTAGRVGGTITDSSGAAVPNAKVELNSKATGSLLTGQSNAAGQYVFPNVAPGDYTLKITAQGFRVAIVNELKVDVAKSHTHDITLEVGQVSETIEVTAQARAELQTVDATVGTVIPGATLPTMPLFSRQVNELLTAQPGTTPAGEVSGARADQNTFTLDGIDVTNNSVGGLGTYMYLGVEGVEEFRVGVANPNSSFGRGAGGQVSLIGRRGGNAYHGGVFWYHQNDNLNANTWTNNRSKVKKPETKDNRFGFTAGGPVWKDKTYVFANYDGRRFPSAATVTRIVPTDSLRQGILRFRDQAGSIVAYDLRTSTACGANGTDRCDPRGLGLSPTIADNFRHLPAGNDTSSGDGLNSIGYTSTVGNPTNYGFFSGRLDHTLNSKWNLFASIRYFRQLAFESGVVGIDNGNVKSISQLPTRQNMETIGATGVLRPNLIANFGFGRVRVRTATDRQRPNASAGILNLAGTNTSAGPIAIDIGAAGGAQNILSEPFDVDTQLARKQQNDNRIYQFNADLNWVKGNHSMQFGFHIRNLPTLHRRDDKVIGSLGALVAKIDSNRGVLNVDPSAQPPACSAARTTNCLRAADAENWNRFYAGVTGMLDSVTVLAVRDGSFKPLPFGELLVSDTSGIRAPEFYWQDTWRMTPGLTFVYGFNYGWQTSPKEKLGRYTLQVDQASGQLISSADFFTARRQGMASGNIVNPNYAFVPINDAKGQPVFNTDWGTFGPRFAVAWNPAGDDGWFGKLVGNRRTVVRAGYGLTYDRQNTVQSVIIPSLGIGFAQTLNANAPRCNATGAGGAGCNATSTNTTISSFRVGVDGTIPVPTVPAQTIPASPFWGGTGAVTYPEFLSFQVDPNMKVGRNHAVDFTIQRELRGDMILELTYAGRFAQRLPQSMNLNTAPYLQLDRASGQTFAQAFDNMANAFRGGATTAPNQPWFQNNMPGGTAALQGARTNFINGNVFTIFQTIDIARMRAGLAPFNNYMSQMAMLRSSTGSSNYNGLFATLRKKYSKGLYYEVNYTFSKSLDQLGAIQNAASVMPNSFDLFAEYGHSDFDITHIFNGVWSYDLPFRSSNPVLKRIIGGWNVSGIFTARSGDPLRVTESTQVWGCCLALGFATPAIPTASPSTMGTTVNSNVAGSGNTGTTGNPATGGSGLNIFADPAAVFSKFRPVNIASDTRSGRGLPLRGLPRWNLDASISKSTSITEQIKFRLSFDFFNLFNHLDFNNPALALTGQTQFGVLTGQLTPTNRTAGSRWIQIGARIDF